VYCTVHARYEVGIEIWNIQYNSSVLSMGETIVIILVQYVCVSVCSLYCIFDSLDCVCELFWYSQSWQMSVTLIIFRPILFFTLPILQELNKKTWECVDKRGKVENYSSPIKNTEMRNKSRMRMSPVTREFSRPINIIIV